MILIADSGATTTTWCALDRGSVVARFESEGYNPNYMNGYWSSVTPAP